MNYTKHDAVFSLDPISDWTWVGYKYADLDWSTDNKNTKPTEAEIDAEVVRLNTGYQTKRKAEYPSIVDQLDLLYHSGIDGWKAQIKKTKDKFPKS
tara:strand:- start:171 stop:458 length:288 start_codon:yes stop_codon:yes gene_type:complete